MRTQNVRAKRQYLRTILAVSWILFGILVGKALAGPPAAADLAKQTKLTEKAKQLDKSCDTKDDCEATGITERWCPAMCGGCGFVISKKESSKFAALRTEAGDTHGHCPIGKCVPSHCETACENKLCTGKVIHEK